MKIKEIYCITIDYSKSFAEMLEVGMYDAVDSRIIPNHFPINNSGQAKIEIELVCYPIPMRSDNDLVRNMRQHGLRPATLPELLALGAIYPQKAQFTIVALGSIWRSKDDGCRYVPCLIRKGFRRELHLNPWDYGWEGTDLFAVVRK